MSKLNLYTALTGLTAVFLLVFFSSPLSAQDHSRAQVDTTKIYKLGEVVVSASRHAETALTSGRNVSVITREEIKEGMYTNVAEALSHQQSLYMIGNRQTPGSLQQGFLRQANSNHTVVMVDGVRISDPSTVNNSLDLSELSLAGVERIEIVRGSHSTLYGSSAIGGVINIITRDRGETGLGLTLDTSQGTFGSGAYSTTNSVHANYTLENGWYGNADIVHKYSNGIDATTDTVTNPALFNPQDREAFSKLDANARIGYKGDQWDLYINYRDVNQDADTDQGSFNDDDNARVEFGRYLVGYGAGYQVTGDLQLKLDGAWTGLNRYFVDDSSKISSTGAYDGIYTETDAAGTLWENEFTGSLSLDHIRLLLGTSSTRQTMTSRSYTYSSTFNFESETDLDSLDLEEVITSGFIQAELNGSILSGSLDRFLLILGGRFARHNRFGGHWTYEINPKIRLDGPGTIYGAITTGFNAPSLYQLYAPEQGFGTFTNRGNPNLEPESSISYEIGWKQWINENNRISLSGYKRKVKNVIEYVYLWRGNTPVESLGFSDYLGDTYLNASRQDILGLELNVESRLHSRLTVSGTLNLSKSTHVFRPGDIDREYTGTHHVQVFESGTFVDSMEKLNRLSRRPSLEAALKVDYTPTNHLSIGVNSSYTGERYDVFYSSNLGPLGALDRSELDPYLVTDIRARYQISNRITIGAKVQNLFNKQYHELRGFNTTGRGYFLNGEISLGY